MISIGYSQKYVLLCDMQRCFSVNLKVF